MDQMLCVRGTGGPREVGGISKDSKVSILFARVAQGEVGTIHHDPAVQKGIKGEREDDERLWGIQVDMAKAAVRDEEVWMD